MDKRVKGGLAFLIGWIGTNYLCHHVFHYDGLGSSGLLEGIILYWIFSGAYRKEAEKRRAQREAEKAQQAQQAENQGQ